MSLLWTRAKEIEAAAKPTPTHAENIMGAMQKRRREIDFRGGEGKHFHEMTPEEFSQHHGTMWHGSPGGVSGMMAGSHSGIHVGTHEAAKQALEARIGRPAEGVWDGTREYGKTLLRNHGYGYGADSSNGVGSHYPSGKATYSSGHPVPMDAKPHIFPVRIVGEMTNPGAPHEDFKANGLMSGQIRRGTARRGYYYYNAAEDAGSVSAVVPNRSHLATHEDFVRHVHETGKHMGRPIPDHNAKRYGLS